MCAKYSLLHLFVFIFGNFLVPKCCCYNIYLIIGEQTSSEKVVCELFQMGKVSKALEVSKMMESAGIKHNNKTYSMLINGFLKLKDWSNAFAIFEDLIRDGLKPDVVLYNNIISAFCGMGNMDRAVNTVKEMRRARHRPTTRTFMPIIHGFARAGEMKRALEIFEMMRMSGCIPTVHTFNALILGLVEKCEVYYAFVEYCGIYIYVCLWVRSQL